MALVLTIENETSLPNGAPVSVTLSEGRNLDIGRGSHLDWTLPDPSRFISGKHCEVRYREGGFWLYDVSTNGTFLNDNTRRIQAPHRLESGDRFAVGTYVIAVSMETDEAPKSPPAVAEPAPPLAAASPSPAPVPPPIAPPPPPVIAAPSPPVSAPTPSASTPSASTPSAPTPSAPIPSAPTPSAMASPPPAASLPPVAPLVLRDAPPLAAVEKLSSGPVVREPAAEAKADVTPKPPLPLREMEKPLARNQEPFVAAKPMPPAPSASPATKDGITARPDGDSAVIVRPPPSPPAPEPMAKAPGPASKPDADTPKPVPLAAPLPIAVPRPPAEPLPANVESLPPAPVKPVEPERPAPPPAPSPKPSPVQPLVAEAATPKPPAPVTPPPLADLPVAKPPPPSMPPAPIAASEAAALVGARQQQPPAAAPESPKPQAATPPETSAPAATAPPPAAPTPGEIDAFLRRFAAGAGITDQIFARQDALKVAEDLGALMRMIVENMTALLNARFKAKRFSRTSNQTMIQALDNNPLKFAPNVEDAIRIMFGPRSRSYLDARQSLESAFGDLKTHQIKTFSAMQQAVKMLVEDLDPAEIDETAGPDKGLAALLGGRRGRLWDIYLARWNAKISRHEDGMTDAFMLYFAEAYDRANDKT